MGREGGGVVCEMMEFVCSNRVQCFDTSVKSSGWGVGGGRGASRLNIDGHIVGEKCGVNRTLSNENE